MAKITKNMWTKNSMPIMTNESEDLTIVTRSTHDICHFSPVQTWVIYGLLPSSDLWPPDKIWTSSLNRHTTKYSEIHPYMVDYIINITVHSARRQSVHVAYDRYAFSKEFGIKFKRIACQEVQLWMGYIQFSVIILTPYKAIGRRSEWQMFHCRILDNFHLILLP